MIGCLYCIGTHTHRIVPARARQSKLRVTMDAFSSASSSEGTGASSTEVMQRLKLQLAQAFVQEFVETVSVKCFEKCVTKPGSSLSGGESSCISRCVDRYLEATNIVGKSLLNEPH